ncbi:MAG TPA: RnfH family protein [Woeseiaceae bacterium]|nr:RnfH family protein [Woeseiaceae bacterium]
MTEANLIDVEVVFATSKRQEIVSLKVAAGTSAAELVELSGIARYFPDENINSLSLGVWGRLVEAGHTVRDGDRVEIYRPLERDPRDARRMRAGTLTDPD